VVAQHIVARAAQLRAEQARWEGMRQQASAKLLELAERESAAEADVGIGMQLDDEQEQLRSQLTTALFQMQEIGRELTEIREALEVEAREVDAQAFDPERERMELVKRDDALKEEAFKADALEKEQRDKEFFENKESDRLEALAKDEALKQDALAQAEREREQQNALGSQQSDLELLADINEQWEYIQAQIAEEFEYIQGEIAKEMEYVVEEIGKEYEYIEQEIREEIEYSVGQARDAVAEAVHEIKTWIQNPVNQKEGKEFLEERKQALESFVADEVFKAAPADIKEAQLRDKIQEQWRAEDAAFGSRNDSLGVRDVVKQGLADLQETLLKAVEAERKIEDAVNKEVEAREQVQAATTARLEKAGHPPEVLEEKLKQLDDAVKKQEQETREKAETRREDIWNKAQDEMRTIEADTRAQAERQDAEKRKEAEREMIDTARSL